jgi:hypothetical protein
MEEEGGDDSEMIDAMEGWDSDQDGENKGEEDGNAKEKRKKEATDSAKVDAS